MVNFLAVLAAAIAYMVLGYVWYSKFMFEKTWMKYIGITRTELEKTQRDMAPAFGMMFVSAVVIAYLIGYFVDYTSAVDYIAGAGIAFLLWLLLSAVNLSSVIFERKHVIVYLIGTGYNLVGFLIMGAIVAAWK